MGAVQVIDGVHPVDADQKDVANGISLIGTLTVVAEYIRRAY
jgi:hypothetical protein